MILQTWLNGNAVFVAGNWWSWATATHLVADLTKTIYGKTPYTLIEHYPFTIENLWDNVPLMTAVANDLPDWFEHIFSLPLASKWKSWDLLLVITWSWNSKNIIRVLQMAKKIGMTTVGWLWFDWWQAKDLCDDTIVIDSKDYGIIEDMHSTLMHNITNYLKLQLAELQTQLQ